MPKQFENKDVKVRKGTFSVDHLEYQCRLVDNIGTPHLTTPSLFSIIFDFACLAISVYGDTALKKNWLGASVIFTVFFLLRLVMDIRKYMKTRFVVGITMKPGGRVVKAGFGDMASALQFCDVLREQCEQAAQAFEDV